MKWVIETICITSDPYQEHIDRTGLRERNQLELHRKDFLSKYFI